MKTKLVFLTCLLLCLTLPSELFAQPDAPEMARIRYLLAKIADCNKDMEAFESELKAYESRMPNINLSTYNQVKELHDNAKKCRAAAQKEYNSIRAKNEGWFKESTSVMDVDGERYTPTIFGNLFTGMWVFYDRLHERFVILSIPTRGG